jgi:hypothetical protein
MGNRFSDCFSKKTHIPEDRYFVITGYGPVITNAKKEAICLEFLHLLAPTRRDTAG